MTDKEKSLSKLVEQGKIEVRAYYFDTHTGSFLGNGNDFITTVVDNYYLNKEVYPTNKSK